MKEIICPSCKKAFEIDQAGFSDIVKQVRDDQFDKELKILVGQAEKEKENQKKLYGRSNYWQPNLDEKKS